MISLEHILSLLDSIESRDQTHFEKTLKELISLSEKRGHTQVAKRLRDIKSHTTLFESRSFQTSQSSPTKRDEVFEWRKSKVRKDDIVLPSNQVKIFAEIQLAYEKADVLRKHGLNGETKILLYGPPGTGKTLFVYALAGELDISVMHIHIDSLVSSYLGETGKNIKMIFEQANSRSCILFLDEFDAVAKQRDDDHELGELKRVVTVLLQNIDEFPSKSILVAATNHEHLLDKAIWRRFNYNLGFTLPSATSLQKLYSLLLKDKEAVDFQMLADLSVGFSGAGIRHVVESAMRKKILDPEAPNLETILVEEIMQTYVRRKINISEEIDKMGLAKALRILRELNPKQYTYAYLEEITGIPDATLHHLVKQL